MSEKWTCSHCGAINPAQGFKCHNCPNTSGDEKWTTPQSPKEALPGKFPPQKWPAKVAGFWDEDGLFRTQQMGNPLTTPEVTWITQAEHESALAEAVRKAREAGIIKGLEMALEDGVSRFDSTGVGRIRDMLASARAAALSAPGEEGERNGKE